MNGNQGRRAVQLTALCALATAASGQSGVPLAMDACTELRPAEAQAKAFVLHPLLRGAELQRRIERSMRELAWQPTLAAARTEALRRSRPILWLQALGELEGFA